MPQLQSMSSSRNEPIVPAENQAKPDNPMCPTCRCAMAVRQVMPSASMVGIGETVYVCDACGIETHRTARRP